MKGILWNIIKVFYNIIYITIYVKTNAARAEIKVAKKKIISGLAVTLVSLTLEKLPFN